MKRSLMVIALVLFAACSGDNGTEPKDDNNNGGGGGGHTTAEDTLRLQTLDDVAQHLDLWWDEGPDTVAARAVAYLKSTGEFEAVGRSGPTSVWARFSNGRLLIIPNDLQPGAPEDTLELFKGEAPVRTAPPAVGRAPRIIGAGRDAFRAATPPSQGVELPVSNQFRVWDGTAACFLTPRTRIRQLLTDHGYVEATTSYPTVEGFAKVKGDGVFVILTHGGPGQLSDNTWDFALWTTTNVAFPTEAEYQGMWDKFELAYMIQPGRNAIGQCSKAVTNYGVTAAFVANHMHFAKNSLVYLNVCLSGTEAAGNLRQAFGNQGASVVVGWDNNLSVGFTFKTLPFFIDRLLGANAVEPKEDPKQRAFNAYDVRDNMAKVGRTVDPISGAQMGIFKVGGDFGLLAPTIQFLSVDDNGEQAKLIIAGLFGTDPGAANRSVTINDTELDNVQWNATGIYCDLPATGSNASGTVQVKVGTGSNARKSNEVNLTEWIGELTYDRDDPGSLAAQMKIKVRIVADIHSFRDYPGEPPFETTVLFGPSRDTKVDATSSGSYSRVLGPCTETWTFGNGGNLLTPFEGTANGTWSYFGSVDSKAHSLQLNIAILCVFNAGSWKVTGPADECDPFNRDLYVSMAIDDCLYNEHFQVPAFRIPMDSEFSVAADERGPCDVQPLIGETDGLMGQAKIKWSEITPFFLPDPDAAR